MNVKSLIVCLLPAAALFGALGAGCKSDKQDSPQQPAGDTPAESAATDTVTEADQPGAGGASGSAALPDSFPEDFPMPEGLTITDGTFTEASQTTQANYLVRATSSQSVAELASFYHQKLVEAGYSVQGQPPPAEAQSAVLPFSNDSYRDASVQLSRAGEITNVIISLPVRD